MRPILALPLFFVACDRTPPTLTVHGPDLASATAVLTIEAEDPSGLGPIALTGAPATRDDSTWTLDLSALPDGEHSLTIAVTDAAWLGNQTLASHTLTVDNTPPVLEIQPTPAMQGDTLAVWFRASEPLVNSTLTLGARTARIYPVDGHWRALIGIDIKHPAGASELAIHVEDALGNSADTTHGIDVAEGVFPDGGRITLTKKQAAARKDEAYREATRLERTAAYAHVDPVQHWSGPLIKPIEARTSSDFGRFRTYNTGEKWHHDGVDLTTRRGSPLVASADGVVLIAKPQAIFGNAIIIGHGHQVTTSYGHLDRIDVEVGQTVTQGQQIGLLGSTGQSTGPHVHWGLVVAGEPVDPITWTEQSFETAPFATP